MKIWLTIKRNNFSNRIVQYFFFHRICALLIHLIVTRILINVRLRIGGHTLHLENLQLKKVKKVTLFDNTLKHKITLIHRTFKDNIRESLKVR